ncbi:MAG: DNA-directed RNA polymerase subunit alpha [Chlamydiota bacterium]
MTVKYGKFELPSNIKVDEATKTNCFARFVAEAFERGFAHTLGNALRRIMLNSLEAPAIISIKIEGVPHEYTAIEGIVEDMTHIILALKGALLRKIPLEENRDTRSARLISKQLEIGQDLLDQHGGQYAVTLKDIVGSCDFEVVNPDHPIFTVTKPTSRRIDLKIAIGRGYVPSERHIIADKVVDEIAIDSAFSPVTLVNYHVENTRVGQDTDYDRLILEVTTDGRILPQEALTFATQIGVAHFEVFDELKLQDMSFDQGETDYDTDREELLEKIAVMVNEIELSVRATNCLSSAQIGTIAELVIMTENELLKFRNFGKKSLNEIKAKLEEMGLSLGMDLNRYGINRDNVKEIVATYLNQEKPGIDHETPETSS